MGLFQIFKEQATETKKVDNLREQFLAEKSVQVERHTPSRKTRLVRLIVTSTCGCGTTGVVILREVDELSTYEDGDYISQNDLLSTDLTL